MTPVTDRPAGPAFADDLSLDDEWAVVHAHSTLEGGMLRRVVGVAGLRTSAAHLVLIEAFRVAEALGVMQSYLEQFDAC